MAFNIEDYSPKSEPCLYREWFEQWEKYRPWDERKDLILRRLNRASQSYRVKFDTRDVTLEDGDALFARLLYSLTYHWTKTPGAPPEDEETTIASLETLGRGGSNPLEDLTLVDSMLVEIRENRTMAKEYMEERFGGYAVSVARRMGLRVSADLDSCEWWLNSYYAMVGLTGNKPALEAYAGRAGIGTWIKRVVYSANRPKEEPDVIQSEVDDDEKPNGALTNVTQDGRLSADKLAEVNEFSEQLRAFWLELSPVERVLLLYWNDKTPKRLSRAVRDNELDDVWDISAADVREAFKLCGVGLASKKFVQNLVKKRKDFLKRFAFEPVDAKTFVPAYYYKLGEFDKEFPVTKEQIVADVKRALGKSPS